jgi:malate dehydrogenase (oxaloacetate-decarboxylating)(NADP+)
MMVETGDADAMISGISRNYRDVIRPVFQTVGLQKGMNVVAGMYILDTKRGPLFLADTTLNVNPSAEDIAEITSNVAKTIRKFKVTPRIALLSYSNFGSGTGEDATKMSRAREIISKTDPNLIVDGEVQANFAINNELMNDKF